MLLIYFKPKTQLGRWSLYTMIIFFVFFGIFLIFIKLGEKGGPTFFSNLKLTISYLIASVSATISFLVGLISVIKKQERSPMVFLAIIIGFFVLFWNLGEILFPH